MFAIQQPQWFQWNFATTKKEEAKFVSDGVVPEAYRSKLSEAIVAQQKLAKEG